MRHSRFSVSQRFIARTAALATFAAVATYVVATAAHAQRHDLARSVPTTSPTAAANGARLIRATSDTHKPRIDRVRFAAALPGAADESPLSHARGGAGGAAKIAGASGLVRASTTVTLWDEIAPPAPLPVPVETTQAQRR